MAAEQPIKTSPEAPNPGRVQERTVNAVQALKAAMQQLRHKAEGLEAKRNNLHSDRAEITKGQSEVARLREELDTKFAQLGKTTHDAERQRLALESASQQLEADREALTIRQKWSMASAVTS